MPVTLEHLKSCGVVDAMVNEGMAIRKFSISRNDRILLGLDLSHRIPVESSMVGLPQNRTESLMADAATKMGMKVRYGMEAVAISQNAW